MYINQNTDKNYGVCLQITPRVSLAKFGGLWFQLLHGFKTPKFQPTIKETEQTMKA